MRLGGADVQLQYLELTDNNIGPRGALAIGTALSQGNNLSLLTLKLDYNTTMGTLGERLALFNTFRSIDYGVCISLPYVRCH